YRLLVFKEHIARHPTSPPSCVAALSAAEKRDYDGPMKLPQVPFANYFSTPKQRVRNPDFSV
ncbi:hypothetical protein, partial [Caballeronia cordobensis]|uniref:hypothetical protein n=1 Tax=Caballeronia cordobensis TaxID=1353886 RepID=UPI001F2C9D3C